MLRLKWLTMDKEIPLLLLKRSTAVRAYYHWLNLQIITTEVSFSEVYSRIQVVARDNDNIIDISFDEINLKMNLPSDLQVLGQFDNISSTEIENFILKNPQIKEIFEIEEMGKSLFDAWKQVSEKLLRNEHKNEKKFLKHLNELWQPALTLLEILISTSREKCEEFYDTNYETFDQNNVITLDLVHRLFARAIQVSLEIHLLLSHGFADGAEARWRTLYETMVICRFITLTGYKTAIRFILHEAVGSYDAIRTHNEVHKTNDSFFISDEELAEFKKRYDEIISVFGKEFKSDYGWASSALPDNKRRVKFEDLERFTGYEYLYPLYKDASGTIHSSSRSNYVSLAAPYNNHSMVVSGASVFGIGEVIKSTAFTLAVFLNNILSAVQTIENKAHIEAVYVLMDELNECCLKVDKVLKEMASTWPEEAKPDQTFFSFSMDDLK